MPQSLSIESQPTSAAIKRQRSSDGREMYSQSSSSRRPSSPKGQLRSSIRVPTYLEKSKGEIAAAFQDLEWKQRFRLFHALENPHTSPYKVDRSEAVVNRNRYGNVQPWDGSRIKLKYPIGGSDYVNASPISLRSRRVKDEGHLSVEGDAAGQTNFEETKYIATQGPKQGQNSHFWYMVHQETVGDTGAIVMLTKCYEANKEKCAEYFPSAMNASVLRLSLDESDGQPIAIPAVSSSGQYDPVHRRASITDVDCTDSGGQSLEDTDAGTVTLTSLTRDASTGCEVRTLDVTIQGVTKKIHHYLYHGWPDFGRPEDEQRMALINLTRKTYEVANGSPRIVHCSAGVGRTGTFIALDFLIREIEQGRFIDGSLYPPLKSPITLVHPDHVNALSSTTPVETWGKSGPPKVQTPTTEDGFNLDPENQYKDDLIYNTVNILRAQRMMMVMNELQFAFLYEVLQEVFWSKYKARSGATVMAADPSLSVQDRTTSVDEEQLPKNKVVKIEGDAEGSEAETEIMGELDTNPSSSTATTVTDKDPYDVVAPEMIKEGIQKES